MAAPRHQPLSGELDAFVYGVMSPDSRGLVVGVGVGCVGEPDELSEEVGGVAQHRVLAGPEDGDLPLPGYLAQCLKHLTSVDIAETVPQLIKDENASLRSGVRDNRGQHSWIANTFTCAPLAISL